MAQFLASVLLGAIASAGASVQDHEDIAMLQFSDSFLHERIALVQFHNFIKDHGRTYQQGSGEYQRRFALFQEHLAAVRGQNSRHGSRWSAGVNSLADWTPEELQSLRGYRHGAKPERSAGGLGLVSTEVHTFDARSLPKDLDYRFLKSSQDVLDQGGCGSCWAVSSASALRSHSELYQEDRTFSAEQILACTPNPKKCGGKGGCEGATAELAMEYVARVGLVEASKMPYKAAADKCPEDMQLPKDSLTSYLKEAVAFPQLTLVNGGGAAFGMVGWKKLPENKVEPLLQALYEMGPVVVSVAAGGPWTIYDKGILDSCDQVSTINHAVVLVGYGEETSAKYWTIQNSWGRFWGEKGFVRLIRLDNEAEEKNCRWDTEPEQGTACPGGPDKVRTCGSCGILYDNVVPKFQLSEKGWFARSGRHNATAGPA